MTLSIKTLSLKPRTTVSAATEPPSASEPASTLPAVSGAVSGPLVVVRKNRLLRQVPVVPETTEDTSTSAHERAASSRLADADESAPENSDDRKPVGIKFGTPADLLAATADVPMESAMSVPISVIGALAGAADSAAATATTIEAIVETSVDDDVA